MSRKALFFDIDGTLLSEITHTVPESTVCALSEARKKGHLVFLNSGRPISYIGPVRNIVETDGFLCGCGTYVEAEGEVLYACHIPLGQGRELKKKVLDYGFDAILEGVKGCYFRKETSRMPEVERLREALAAEGCDMDCDWEKDDCDFDKFCLFADENSDREGIIKAFGADIHMIDRGNDFYECVPAGHSKATAIELVLEKYGIPNADAYVFGDSTNDLAMFEYAENAVLMGRHDKELEPFATFITKTVEEDGIMYAMRKLGII